MSDVNTNPDALKAMAAGNPDEPVCMLNLLRYREIAESGFGVDGLSGEAAYRVYGEKFAGLNPRYGGQPVWLGEAHHTIIGAETWDIIILVHYPTRKHFTDMLQDPDYQAIAPIRAAALADSRLIESSQLLPKLNT